MVMGIPLAIVMGLAATACVTIFTFIPPQTVFQQLYQGSEYDLLQAVVFFIVAGAIMTRGTLASRLVRIGQALVGGFTGGLAITSVLICMFFAAVSGSSPATVVAIGSIMIPALIQSGYNSRFSIGLLTSAGSLGILIPPSIPMIIWAVVMGVSVTKQFMAGFLPGGILGGTLIIYSYLQARKNRWRTPSRLSMSEIKTAFREGIWGLFMPILVLGGIYSGLFTATEAAAVAFVYALFVELVIHKSLKPRDLIPVLKESILTSSMLLFIIANTSVLSYYFSVDQIPLRVAEFLLEFINNKYLFLLFVNIGLLIMGCFMDVVSAMLVLGPVFYPLLQKFGVDPIHFGIIMVLNIEVAFLTPPFGVNLFVSSGITHKDIIEVSRSVLPFLVLIYGVLFLVTYVPWISLGLTRLLQ
ncbi:MAG: TRAP transporter large permease [Deltaproteobacteria bacterium]|nr:TRAP transporter large permease [Deltaproteobacteria bacterium]MBW1929968.1 TRAP transporter large permease [Deltaproteobacteria bacterium]MBW2026063.1 TRAP transporter large permease [Deltaproteobacteria bacterium]MBW2127485.1 TRAP transporter large permease [Deltaproteobacteria bacterium]